MPWNHTTYSADTKEEMCHQEEAYTKEGSSWGSQPIQPCFKYQKQEATPAWIKCDSLVLFWEYLWYVGTLLLLWYFIPWSCNLRHLWFEGTNVMKTSQLMSFSVGEMNRSWLLLFVGLIAKVYMVMSYSWYLICGIKCYIIFLLLSWNLKNGSRSPSQIHPHARTTSGK